MHLPVELFLALRYLRPRRSFVSVITVLSFLGVMIGVATLIVVLSVMAGFQQTIADKIIGFNAHITVSMADGSVMYDYDKAMAIIKTEPGVVAASPIIMGPVIVHVDHKLSAGFIKSVPADGDDPVLPLKKYLKLGEFELRGDSVIIGREWSRRYGVFPGDKIQIFGAKFVGAIDQPPGKNRTIPLPEELIVRGVFESGRYDYDGNFFLVSTEMAQEIWGMHDAVHGIAVRVKNTDEAQQIKDNLNRILPPEWRARTWMDDNKDLFNQIVVERVVMACILCLILIVAAFGLCSTLITVTIQKSREIGLMKALGAGDAQVCAVFLFHGLVVGLAGSLAGLVIGLFLLRNLNHVRDFLLYTFHIQVFPGSVYNLPEIPAVINPAQVTLIAISGVVFCVVAALIPAVSASRLAPARALRYE